MTNSGWERDTSPFHTGEQELQDRLGVKQEYEVLGRQMMRAYMPEQHREFFSQLPFIIAGSIDTEGWPWASILVGNPGFISTPTDRSMALHGGRTSGDPFWENAESGKPVGFVGIELSTRRRNRVNGVVRNDLDGLSLEISQSFGNCPKYIHTRDLSSVRNPDETHSPVIERFTTLSEDLTVFIENADTFFVASHNSKDDYQDTGGVDVSHRGGKPGFIKVEGNTLTIPDYAGNQLYNTFGNFLLNPKAGLIFVDFDTGDIVQVTGAVELLWDGDPNLKAFSGAERGWKFHLDHGHVLKAASPYRWQLNEISPFVDATGDWKQTSKTLAQSEQNHRWQAFKVIDTVAESSVIKSFYLEPKTNGSISSFKPGQFISLRVTLPDSEKSVTRTYTVSSAPSDSYYRISVKREGVVSSYLHDMVKVGSTLEIRSPNGGFWMDTEQHRPAVLLAGGVGITPMLSMLRAVSTKKASERRPVTLIHASKTTEERAFENELVQLRELSNGELDYISVVSRPKPDEIEGVHYHVKGRVSRQLLQRALPIDDYDFYLCGPNAFMQDMYDLLIELGVSDQRIYAEAFGPASINRVSLEPSEKFIPDVVAADEALVRFEKSQIEKNWQQSDGSLLDFAEAQGLTPEFSCRTGNCGACLTKLKSGKVAYEKQPSFQPPEGHVLLCCSVPSKSNDAVIIDI